MRARTSPPRAGENPPAAKTAVTDPVARRIHRQRLAKGYSLARLAERATKALAPFSGQGRQRSVSTSYVSLIENGHKVPDEAVAVAIGRALSDDIRIYRAWVRTRKRADLDVALAAAETLRSLLDDDLPPRAAIDEAPASAGTPLPRRGKRGAKDVSRATTRLRVAVIPRGADPGEGVRPSCDVLEWLRFDLETLTPAQRERLDRPYALRLDEACVRRVRGKVRAGTYGVILRKFMPIRGDAVYAVRHRGETILSRALWNGSSLLLMPAEGESDFVVVDIGSETLLGHHIIGEAVAVPREAGLPLDAREPRPETTPADAPPTVTQTPAAAQKKSSS